MSGESRDNNSPDNRANNLHLNDPSKTINILSLNVCGLVSKQIAPEFLECIQKYDLIGFQETKTDCLDSVFFENYTLYFKHRKEITKRKSGGICLAIKSDLKPYITLLDTDNPNVLWFVLSGQLSETEDTLYGVVYLPPEYSDYATDEPFSLIQQDIDSFPKKYNNMCLFGDWNSRTKNLPDYIDVDFDVFHENDLDELYLEMHSSINDILSNTNVCINRNNKDSGVNNYGYRFVDFLQCNELFILNGRTNGDYEGCVTCKGVSTVDYFVCSSNLLSSVESLKVLDFCPMLSDVHSPVSMSMRYKNISVVTNKQTHCTSESVKMWNRDLVDDFVKNLEQCKVDEIFNELGHIETLNEIPMDMLNNTVSKIGTLFKDNAKTCFGTSKKRPESVPQADKRTWFNKTCNVARRDFNRAKYLYKLRKNNANKTNLKTKSKEYKKTLRKHFMSFKRNNVNKIRNIKKSNPKAYWKVLCGKTKTNVSAELSELYQFFKNVNSGESINLQDTNEDPNFINEELNTDITLKEIENAVKLLKTGKACGVDEILNEHIKNTFPLMKHVYVKLFNIVFNHGIIPDNWTIGVINPIFKNKGSSLDPSNYRPITLLSCLGKLFTAVLNNRLQNYASKHELINEHQAGFRAGYSTTDNMFILQTLINILKNSKKKLFCAFIDLKQAFDTVWRSGLWSKLINYNVNGKFLNVIKSMYNQAKSCVSKDGQKSSYFKCNIGVRQGENLSPILFSFYLNDLHDFFADSRLVNGINCAKHVSDDCLTKYLKLFMLLYADDTVIVSETEQDLQQALNLYEQYCDLWKLSLNTSKTKILVFSKGRQKQYNFFFKTDRLEVVNEYKYLGILFSRSGSFNNAKKHIAKQGTKAMYCLIKKAKELCLPIDMQLELFSKTVKPILLYGCEIWGYGNIDVIERVQLKFIKHILHLKSCTSNCMVYGETGTKPLSIDIETRIVSFWAKLVNPMNVKLSSKIYAILLSQFNHTRSINFPWIANVKHILTSCGLINVWEMHEFPNIKWLTATIKQKLSDLFINQWYSLLENSSNCVNYKLFKRTFGFEQYLVKTPPVLLRYMIKFRNRNHKLPVETGNWNKIPLNLRICTICNLNIGDEFHYLFECPAIANERKRYIRPKFFKFPNILLFDSIMNINTNTVEYRKLCIFVKHIITKFT